MTTTAMEVIKKLRFVETDPIVIEIPRLEDEEIDILFYQDDEIGEMRHTAFMIECGLEEDPRDDRPDVEPIPWKVTTTTTTTPIIHHHDDDDDIQQQQQQQQQQEEEEEKGQQEKIEKEEGEIIQELEEQRNETSSSKETKEEEEEEEEKKETVNEEEMTATATATTTTSSSTTATAATATNNNNNNNEVEATIIRKRPSEIPYQKIPPKRTFSMDPGLKNLEENLPHQRMTQQSIKPLRRMKGRRVSIDDTLTMKNNNNNNRHTNNRSSHTLSVSLARTEKRIISKKNPTRSKSGITLGIGGREEGVKSSPIKLASRLLVTKSGDLTGMVPKRIPTRKTTTTTTTNNNNNNLTSGTTATTKKVKRKKTKTTALEQNQKNKNKNKNSKNNNSNRLHVGTKEYDEENNIKRQLMKHMETNNSSMRGRTKKKNSSKSRGGISSSPSSSSTNKKKKPASATSPTIRFYTIYKNKENGDNQEDGCDAGGYVCTAMVWE